MSEAELVESSFIEEEQGQSSSNAAPVPKKIRERQKRSFIGGAAEDSLVEEDTTAPPMPSLPPRSAGHARSRNFQATGEDGVDVLTMSEIMRRSRKQNLDMVLIYGILGVIVVGALLGFVISRAFV